MKPYQTVDDVYPSRWLRSDDLRSHPVTVVVSAVTKVFSYATKETR